MTDKYACAINVAYVHNMRNIYITHVINTHNTHVIYARIVDIVCVHIHVICTINNIRGIKGVYIMLAYNERNICVNMCA